MLAIKYLATESIKPYNSNSRTHSKEQVSQIAKSIEEFGFTNPILIDEKSVIVAGHGRLEAALYLKLDKVPTILLKSLSDAQRRAYVLADNQIAINASWDYKMLQIELEKLSELDFDLELLAFDSKELEALLNPDNSSDLKPDDFVEFDENIDTEHRCPKCGYEWSGSSQ